MAEFVFEDYNDFLRNKKPKQNGCTIQVLNTVYSGDVERFLKDNETNVDCFNCVKSEYCINSNELRHCYHCKDSKHCTNCYHCLQCEKCLQCVSCEYSKKLQYCENCEYCKYCKYCYKCDHISNEILTDNRN